MIECQVVKEGQDWVNAKFDVRLDNKLDSKLDIQTEEYNLNYQFKYSKSVADSGSIVIMVST